MTKKFFFMVCIRLILLAAVGVTMGCGIGRSVFKGFTKDDAVLAKRVKVLSFLDQTHLGSHLGETFTAEFISRLRATPLIMLDERPLGLSLQTDLKSPRFGIVTPKAFIQKAQELGLNILITGVLNPIDVTTRRKGFWPFRKNRRFYEVSMVINMVDVNTGALLYTKLGKAEGSVPEDVENIEDKNEFMLGLIRKDMSGIVKKQASNISEILSEKPWAGKILAVDGKDIRIGGGKDVGIKTGLVFQVFSRGELIRSQSGESYPVRGRKVGKIEVTSPGEREAMARPLSGGPFEVGQMIRLER
ncbi:MAG: hypothetical protein WAL98_02500 [Desulfatiglandaceae bacterium]|jgi:hypothetical protein